MEQAIKTKGAVPHAPGTGEMASLARASRMAEAMAAQSAAARETWAHLRVKVRHPIHGTCVVVAGPTASDLGPVLEVEAPSFSRHLVLVRDLGAV